MRNPVRVLDQSILRINPPLDVIIYTYHQNWIFHVFDKNAKTLSKIFPDGSADILYKYFAL